MGRLIIFLFAIVAVALFLLKLRRIIREDKRKAEREAVSGQVDDAAEQKQFYADEAKRVGKLSKRKGGGPEDREKVEEFIDENS